MPMGEIVLTDGSGRILRRLSHRELDALLESRGDSRDRDQAIEEEASSTGAYADETAVQEFVAEVLAPDASDAEHMGVSEKRERTMSMPKRNPGVTAAIATILTTTPAAIQRRCGRIGRGDRTAEDHPELAQHLDAVQQLATCGPTRVIRQGAKLVLSHFSETQ